MRKLSIIVPTITGREEMFADVIAAYRERTPGYELELITPKDERNWPAACNVGMRTATGEFWCFGSDDLFPLLGWADAAVAAFDEGVMPAAQVWNFEKTDGPCANEQQDGPAGSYTAFSRVTALRADWARAIGPWPEIDYYADNWVCDALRAKLGVLTRVTAGYAFVHMWHQHGRLDAGDWVGRSLPAYMEALKEL